MADNKDKKVLNVPALRFPEFTEEWKNTTLKNECSINPTSDKLKDEFVYVDLESVEKGELTKKQVIEKENAPSRAQRVLRNGDVLFQCVRPYQKNNYLVKNVSSEVQWVASTGYAQLRTGRNNPAFIYHLLNTSSFNKKVIVRCTGSSYPAINSDDLSKIHFYICSDIEEQKRIADFLTLLDERIATQNKIIEKLGTLIKGIRDYVLNNKLQNTTKKKLGELCTITTGKLDANAMKSEGLYPFFTCAEDVYRIDSFAFDTEALLVSGNGANLGYIHYYKGKFNAYQRTYVLSNFIEDIHYIQIYLEAYLHKRIALEKSTSNTPYIVLATLAEMPIIIPNIKIQKDISNKILILKSKLITEIHIRNCYKDMRQFLLSQMFI